MHAKCLLAPFSSSMQSLLDVCYEYDTDDILFKPILNLYVRFLIKKTYKQFTTTVFIAVDALKFTKEFLITLNMMISIIMLRQMRLL